MSKNIQLKNKSMKMKFLSQVEEPDQRFISDLSSVYQRGWYTNNSTSLFSAHISFSMHMRMCTPSCC